MAIGRIDSLKARKVILARPPGLKWQPDSQVRSLEQFVAADTIQNSVKRILESGSRWRKRCPQKGADAFHEFVTED